jgi:hypothetical protein
MNLHRRWLNHPPGGRTNRARKDPYVTPMRVPPLAKWLVAMIIKVPVAFEPTRSDIHVRTVQWIRLSWR